MLSKKSVLYVGFLLLISLFLLVNSVAGESIEDKLSNIIQQRLGLDPGIYQVIETEYQGERVVLVVIFGNEKVYRSSLGSDIKSKLKKHERETPVAISVLTRNREVKFQPYALRIIQNDETSQANQVVGITDGFKDGELPEKVPIDDEVFWGSKGVITLGSSFDTSTPFRIKYGTTSASFSLGTPQAQVQQEEKQELSEEAPPKEGEGLQSQEFQESESPSPETSSPRREERSSPPVSNRSSRSGQGMALLAQLGTLLAITLSFL